MEIWKIVLIVIASIVALLLFIGIPLSYIKSAPDTATFITGIKKKPRILIGRSGWRIPFFQRIDRVSLKVMSIDIKTSEVPTEEFINIDVDAIANIKISANEEKLQKAAQIFLNNRQDDIAATAKEILEGNMREILGQMNIVELVHNRNEFSKKVQDSATKDMEAMGLDIVNIAIQNFSDREDVLKNLGIDNVTTISKAAQIARANNDKEVAMARADAAEKANAAQCASNLKIAEQNTAVELRKAELKKQTETAEAEADAAYEIKKQQRQSEINVAAVDANIAKEERNVKLGEQSAIVEEKKLEATVKKQADAQKYSAERFAEAELVKRQKAAEAELAEAQKQAEIKERISKADLISAQNAAEAVKAQAEASKAAALYEAEGIKAKGEAEATAILKKADAMKQYGEAATLKLVLDSNLLPEVVKAASEPLAAAYSKVGNITLYGDGANGKLANEIAGNVPQILDAVQKTTGLDLKSVLAGVLGTKLISNTKEKTVKSDK